MSEQLGGADAAAYRSVGWTLLGGLLTSIAVMVIGLISTALFGGDSTKVLPLNLVLPQLFSGHAPAILDIGILLLFATPLLAVLVALLSFIRQGDAYFTGVTAVLLVMLVISFAVALH